MIWNACLLGLLLLPVSAATFPRLLLEAPRGPVGAAAVVRRLVEPGKSLGGETVPDDSLPCPAPRPDRAHWSTVVCLA